MDINMKNIIKFIAIIAVLASSCSKILDVEPTAAISVEEALKDKNGIKNALTGSYNALQMIGSYGRNQIIVQDLAADNLIWSGTTMDYSEISNNNIPAENAIIDGMWTANFDGINRVNNIISALPNIGDVTDEERNYFEGEALFLRALFNFNLAWYFGGIPIKLTPTNDLSNLDQSRNTMGEVMNQIISDLVSARQKLSDNGITGRADTCAADAMLARVYLAQFHLTNDPQYADMAIERASVVINNPEFSLAPVYSDLFNLEAPNSTEPIFEVVFDVQNSNRLAQYFITVDLNGRYEVAPSEDYIQSFEEGDVRLEASVAYDNVNKPYVIKYTDLTSGTDRVIVLRLAEMYLIRAEAMAYSNGSINEIITDIDLIRNRAGLAGTTASDYASLKLAIEDERRHELAFEGQRWYDLVRTQRAVDVIGIDEYQMLFPIPLSEMQTNKLMSQNPGY
jgi:starch-binding outer membrane protein, SusD/RagB family